MTTQHGHTKKHMSGSGRRTQYRKHLTDAVINDLPEPDESIGRRVGLVVGTRGGNMFDVVVAPPLLSTTATLMTTNAVISETRNHNGTSKDIDKVPLNSTTNNDNDINNQLIPSSIQTIRRTPQLAFLPSKFRKLIWIKRNDYVIVECGDDKEEDGIRGEGVESATSGGGFRYVITNILYKDQVKHIKSRGMWPLEPLFNTDVEETKVDPSLSDAVAVTAGCSRRDKRIIDCPPELDDSHSYTDDDDDDDEKDDSYNDDTLSNHHNHDGRAYEKDGIVFNDSLRRDDLVLNTNRISALRVEDSSDDDSEDSD